MKERKTRAARKPPEPITLPPDHGLIFLEKNENVIAICKHKGCGNIIFKGSDHTQIERHILRERLADHMGFYAVPHQIDVIYPRSKKVVDANNLDPIQYTSDYVDDSLAN